MEKLLSKTREFNKTAGVPVKDSFGYPKESNAYLQIELIKEELQETLEAFKAKDDVEVLDGLADTFYVLSGLVNLFGLDDKMEEAIDRVHKSNMSKFPKSYEEAIRTVDKYKNNNVSCHMVNRGESKVVVRDDGKILKSVNYKPVYLVDLVK